MTYHGEPDVQLADFGVSSNSTSLLHGEQMIDAGGAFELNSAASDDPEPNDSGVTLTNRTNFDLKRAGVLRRTTDGIFEMAWIGDLPPGRKVTPQFEPVR